MGGINQDNIAQVVARGARHPAVMSAVTAAPDVTARPGPCGRRSSPEGEGGGVTFRSRLL